MEGQAVKAFKYGIFPVHRSIPAHNQKQLICGSFTSHCSSGELQQTICAHLAHPNW